MNDIIGSHVRMERHPEAPLTLVIRFLAEVGPGLEEDPDSKMRAQLLCCTVAHDILLDLLQRPALARQGAAARVDGQNIWLDFPNEYSLQMTARRLIELYGGDGFPVDGLVRPTVVGAAS